MQAGYSCRGRGRVPVRPEVGPAQRCALRPDEDRALRSWLGEAFQVDGQPAVISTSYYPLWLAAGTRLESAGALPEGPDNLIEQLGHRFARGMELLQARMPTPDEVRLLELVPGVPVVRVLHIDYDADGRTLQVADDLYSADRHEFAFEWTESDGGRDMSEWPRNWAELTRGVGCEMCEFGRPDADHYGIRIHAGRYTDAYLQRADVQRGYTVVIWRGRHVTEPTELDDAEASGYWSEVLAVARALISMYKPLKMNYETLGNSLPHLHTT